VHGRIERAARYRGGMDTSLFFALVLPLVLVELVLIIVALRDLLQPERRVRGGAKWVWVLVIVFVQLLGPILYLTIGRTNE
jgi:hypothetical protein